MLWGGTPRDNVLLAQKLGLAFANSTIKCFLPRIPEAALIGCYFKKLIPMLLLPYLLHNKPFLYYFCPCINKMTI